MWAKALILLASVLSLASCAVANEFHHADVAVLTGRNFDEKITDGGVWFVKFYAPWCGHCKRLAPAWGELATAFKGKSSVNVAHIDCTAHKDTCNKYEVKGYPTLKVFVNGSVHKHYTGLRDIASLKGFLEGTANDVLKETVA